MIDLENRGLPIDRISVRVRFEESVVFPHFLHGGILQGLIRAAAGEHDLEPWVAPFAPESGVVRFGPGSEYCFGVTLIGAARRLSRALESGLRSIGRDENRRGHLLRSNFEVVEWRRLEPLDLHAEVGQLAGRSEIRLRMLSPLRVRRPDALQVRGRAFLNQECFPVGRFLDAVGSRLQRLQLGDLVPEIPAGRLATAEPRGLLWIDLPVDRARPGSPRGITAGGVLGELILRGIPEAWLPVLGVGAQVHVGEKILYGFGRYFFPDVEAGSDHAFRPAAWLPERAADPAVVRGALAHMLADSNAAGIDGVRPERFADDPESLDRIKQRLCERPARADELLGFLQEKKDGSPRALAIPTVRDRLAQRSVLEFLGPALDTLMEDCSFAYRKGLSRKGAAAAIQRAYDEGYRYVLDADIEAFFDSVPWGLMYSKIRSLYPMDDSLVDLVDAWLRAPVRFEGRRIRRKQGLPQGSPISPVLANLFLDEVDEALLDEGFRLVRYADDFVVLARDLREAERARDRARRALAELGLVLSSRKTEIRPFDSGFTYLGYLFCRSVCIDGAQDDELADEAPEPAFSSQSWLAQVPMATVRWLQRRRRKGHPPVRVVPLVEDAAVQPREDRPLYVSRPGCIVRVRGEQLQVVEGEEIVARLPVRELSHVVLVGRQRPTVPALFRLARLGVPVFFTYATGQTEAVFGPLEADYRVWLHQARCADDPQRRLAFVQETVAAKLASAATLVSRFDWPDREVVEELRALSRSCINKSAVETLRGIEGRGSALFFGALGRALKPEWGFEGRKRRPAPDPINSMLSYGYSILYRHLVTALTASGLNPYVGLFHQPHGRFLPVAADLQEEFRYLVDAHVWAMISRREITPEDFESGRWSPACRLRPAAREKFTRRFLQRLATRYTPVGAVGEPTRTYFEHMAAQTSQLRDYVTGVRDRYRAIRARA